jgi:hypothetical protein
MTQPDYFHESITGILWRRDGILALSVAPMQPPTDAEIVMEGDITLRYGIEVLQTPHILIPGYFETENGAIKTGRAAWDFIWSKFQLYPRADVIGLRTDGKDAQLLMRNLDFGEGAKVLAYSSEAASVAVGLIQKLNAPADAVLPELLAQYAKGLK